jgi:hypothetical protein
MVAASGNFGGLVEIMIMQVTVMTLLQMLVGDTGFDKSDVVIKARYESGNHS